MKSSAVRDRGYKRFGPSDPFEMCGLRMRIRLGSKTRGDAAYIEDLVLEFRNHAGRWVPLEMPLLFLMVDFICENEDVLYPGLLGGRKLIQYLEKAWKDGYRDAVRQLESEKSRAQQLRYKL